MKNTISVILTIILAICLSSCGASKNSDLKKKVKPVPTTTTTAATTTTVTTKPTTTVKTTTTTAKTTTKTTTKATTVKTTPTTTAPTVTEKKVPEQLGEDAVYEQLCKMADSFEEKIVFDGFVSGSVLEKARYRLKLERPDVFWYSGTGEQKTLADHTEVTFYYSDGLDRDSANAMHTELLNKVDSIAEQASQIADDYERILFVHDYIIDNADYDISTGTTYNNSPYGCLIEGKTACGGYSGAFQMIMRKLSFDCGQCFGVATEAHAWNYIYYDDSYYWVDVTWDEECGYDYFMLNDNNIRNTRSYYADIGQFVPTCNSMKNNYYARAGQYFDCYDFDRINQLLNDAAANGNNSVVLMFGDADTANSILKSFFGEGYMYTDQFNAGVLPMPYQSSDIFKCEIIMIRM